jgi:integrase/recombinase XerD
MTSRDAWIAPHGPACCAQHLGPPPRVSPPTMARSRAPLRLWLSCVKEPPGQDPSPRPGADLDAPSGLPGLASLAHPRGHAVRSRHRRWAAIRSLARCLALRDPAHGAIVPRVLALPVKRADTKRMGSRTREEGAALLAAPDRACWRGRRAHALLLPLSNRGARVSAGTTLPRAHLGCGPHTLLQRTGKGRQERTVPWWPHTRRTFHTWFAEWDGPGARTACPNARGGPRSRDGGDSLLQRAVHKAPVACPSLGAKQMTPPVMRHTTALPLFQSGVDSATRARWGGHESMETPHVSLAGDLMHKAPALQKLAAVEGALSRVLAADPRRAFRTSL